MPEPSAAPGEPAPPSPAEWSPGRRVAAGLFLFALAWAIYGVTLNAPFYYDELNVLGNGGALRLGADLRAHLLAPRVGFERYRPLYTWSLALNYAADGTAPLGYHLVGLFFHALTGAGVYLAFRRWPGGDRAAFLAGLLFAVHAIHVEPVANIAQRSGPLAGPLLLATWWLHAHGSRRAYAGALAAFFVALLTYEGVAPLPAVLFLGDHVLRRREPGALRRALGRAAGYGIPLVAYLALRGSGNAASLPAYFAGLTQREVYFAVAQFFCTEYLPGFLVGFLPLPDYALPAFLPCAPGDPRAWGCAALALAPLGVAAWAWWTRRSVVGLGVLATYLLLLPVLNLIFPLYTVGAQRFAYLPSLGVALAFGAAAAAGVGSARRGVRRLAGAGATAAILLHVAVAAHGAWSMSEPLRAHDYFLWLRPEHPTFLAGKAALLRARGDIGGALACLERAAGMGPPNFLVLTNLGEMVLAEGDRERARALFERVTQTFPAPQAAVGWVGLAELACTEEQWEEAERLCVGALGVYAWCGRALELRGRLRARIGKEEEAIELFAQANRCEPLSSAGWYDLGLIRRRRGERAEATACLGRAVAGGTMVPEAWVLLGLVLEEEGRPAEAAAAWRAVLRRRPEWKDARRNLMRVLPALGAWEEALALCRASADQDPGWLDARLCAATALDALGREPEALAELRRFLEEAAGRPEYADARYAVARQVAEREQGRAGAGGGAGADGGR
ncbi:MAG: tetratricopeptide repeat protein [Planctomycetes bacterium]|nr:tetratricopeptide repeat protein [Planctomycetota bacterium]